MTRVRLRRPGRIGRAGRSVPLGRGRALGALAAAAALAGPALASPAHAATPQYKLTIVGATGTELFGINKNGDVFGIAIMCTPARPRAATRSSSPPSRRRSVTA